MSEQITGKVVVRVDGAVVESENQATFTPEGVTRNPVRHGGKTFYSEEETPALLEFKALITKDTDVIELGKITGATAFFEADTGQRYVLRNAFTTKVVAHDGSGVTSVEMSCQSSDKV